MSLGSPPRKSSRSTSTLLFDPASRNSSPLSPRTFTLRFGHVWMNRLLDAILEILFPPRVYGSFQFTWDHSRCTDTQAFISKKILYLIKEYKTLQDAWSGKSFFHKDQVLFVDDMPSKCVQNPLFSGYYPFSWSGLDTPRVLNNITETLYLYLLLFERCPIRVRLCEDNSIRWPTAY